MTRRKELLRCRHTRDPGREPGAQKVNDPTLLSRQRSKVVKKLGGRLESIQGVRIRAERRSRF